MKVAKLETKLPAAKQPTYQIMVVEKANFEENYPKYILLRKYLRSVFNINLPQYLIFISKGMFEILPS